MDNKQCPGCSGAVGPLLNRKTIQLQPATKLGECTGCGGLVGDVDARDLKKFVILEFETVDEVGESVYFDLNVISPLSADRNYRTHGWYHPCTKRVVQFG